MQRKQYDSDLNPIEKIWADGGYKGDLFDWVKGTLGAVLEVVEREAGQKDSRLYRNVGW
jgi:hypothetical protein